MLYTQDKRIHVSVTLKLLTVSIFNSVPSLISTHEIKTSLKQDTAIHKYQVCVQSENLANQDNFFCHKSTCFN